MKPGSSDESVNHYDWIPGIRMLDVAGWFNFRLGNVIKYVWRAGRKGSTTRLRDLKAARNYLNAEIAAEEGGELVRLPVPERSDLSGTGETTAE